MGPTKPVSLIRTGPGGHSLRLPRDRQRVTWLTLVMVGLVVVHITTFLDGRVFVASCWADDPGAADCWGLTLLFGSGSSPSVWVIAMKQKNELDR